MIGDFDGSSNEFWRHYRDEAKSHDEARINTLRGHGQCPFIRPFIFCSCLYRLGYADLWPHRLDCFLLLSPHS